MATKINILEAKCKECGASVGCGCQLVNGLCPTCASKIKK